DHSIYQADAKGFVGGNHLTGENQFVSNAFSTKARQALRASITRKNSELNFGLPEFCVAAGGTHGASECEIAPAHKRETVDRGNARLTHGLQAMNNLLT